MNIQSYIKNIKPQLLKTIQTQCNDIIQADVPYSKIISQKLYEYTSRGKLLRGVFVCLSAESFGQPINEDVLNVAAALEVAQSAILIHDDVMDQDDMRRNKPSIHKTYQQEEFSIHGANSLAICLGDVGLFHIFRYLPQNISVLFSKELTKTAIGQTYDVMKGLLEEDISEEDIKLIIQYKTANYTFNLPFQAGMILANCNDIQQKNLVTELSQAMGIIFQLRDDEFHYEIQNDIGKSLGGDIRENKKTLCRALLIKKNPHIYEYYGNDDYTKHIQELYQKSNAKKTIQTLIQTQLNIAEGILYKLSIDQSYFNLWYTLLEYLHHRKF